MKTYVPGCIYNVRSEQEKNEKMATGHFSIIQIHYENKPKWQFWKRKKVGYYEMMYSHKKLY